MYCDKDEDWSATLNWIAAMFSEVEGKIVCLYKSAQRKNQDQSFGHYGNKIYHHKSHRKKQQDATV